MDVEPDSIAVEVGKALSAVEYASPRSRVVSFTGWVGAACEQQVELAAGTDGYTRRRLAQARAGQLTVTVDHADLLILP